MRRLWLLLTIAVLCICAGLAILWQRAPTSTPMIPLVPAAPLATGPGDPGAPRVASGSSAATGDVAAAASAASDASSAPRPDRVEPAPPPGDERVAVLVVEVLRPSGPAAPGLESAPPPTAGGGMSSPATEPVPDVEVEVVLDGRPADELLRRLTDARGLARFEIPGGDDTLATVRCPVAAPAQVRLQAEMSLHLTLQFRARGIVRGTVVDAAGRGIAGADLVLLPSAERDPPWSRLCRVGRSRADGSFDVVLAVGGALGAQHPSYAPSAMWPVAVQADPTRAPTSMVVQLSLLTAPARLQGRVVDSTGQPVADAELEFRSVAAAPAGATLAAPPRRVRSADHGAFVVQGLRPGRIEFAARAAGHGFQRGVVELGAGAAQVVEIRLRPGCEVHGRVEDDQGTPVADARVWSGASEDLDSVATTTAADGTFQLTGLPPGTVGLTAREGAARAAEPTARRAQTRLELLPGEVAHWVATLRPPEDAGFLRGQLVDRDGARLPTWRLVLRSRDGTTTGRTDSGGFFHVRLPGTGMLDVFVHAPGAPPNAFAHAVQRGVMPGQGPVRIAVDRQPAWGALTGRVQTSTQEPVPATLICWHHQRQEQARFQALADGTFLLDAVPPGTIDLYAEYPGYARLARPNLDVTAGPPDSVGTLVLDASAVLFGQVIGPNGESPADLQIRLLTDAQPVVGEYAAGTYRFASAPPGRHVLQVQGTSVAPANLVVELQAGVERQQDMQLQAGVPRRVVVRAPTNAGTMVSLALRRVGEAHIWHGAAVLEIDGNAGQGRAEFLVYMAPGSYEAIAWTGEAWEGHATIPFVVGDDSPVAFSLVAR
ncbi:MAG: carboxypeptidase regulatory-like domain-containing protein [Planctomycetes bacterium]|nr:carboxypeptidase regulatory-like domain-containing protein [Planctomycetota bacterium]